MEESYLLTRQEAARRYRISVRTLDNLYRRYSDFPIIRMGRRVLIHRAKADEWFGGWIGNSIE